MRPLKVFKDRAVRSILGKDYVPESLFDFSEYFRHFKEINFEYHKEGDITIAVSTDFKYGSIVTSGRNKEELDKNIKDAILTSFEVPSAYLDKINLHQVDDQREGYALA